MTDTDGGSTRASGLPRWRAWVRALLPAHRPVPLVLPTQWETVPEPVLLERHLRPVERAGRSDPRARALLDSGRRIQTLELAQWLVDRCPEEAPRLFADGGYNLDLFVGHGTPEALAAALATIPADWQGRPVDALARRTGWKAIGLRGVQWNTALLCWAGDRLRATAQPHTRIEREVVAEAMRSIKELVALDPSSGVVEQQDAMGALFRLASHPEWAAWAAHFGSPPVEWAFATAPSGGLRADRGQFVPGRGWPEAISTRGPLAILRHPLQVLAHDQLWGTDYVERSLAVRGTRHWGQYLTAADVPRVRHALLQWGPETGPGLAPQLSGAALEQIVGVIPKEEIAQLLKSPHRARRERGLRLMTARPARTI